MPSFASSPTGSGLAPVEPKMRAMPASFYCPLKDSPGQRLQPHRLERYMSSNDPNFEQKAADIIGLELNPPAHAAVLCVDEKTATARHAVPVRGVQYADPRSDRKDRGAAHLGALRSVSHRHRGASGGSSGDSRDRRQPVGAQDQASGRAFLSEHPTVQLHLTPTYSSFLNQVALWFAKISRDVITRGVFSSVADLKSDLMPYIRQYNKNPRVVKWHYVDPSRHIGA